MDSRRSCLLGVVYLAVIFGSLPWIALVLALSFALYGAVKKIAPLNSLYGLIMETGILLLPAISFLAFSDFSGTGVFLHAGILSDVLLVGAGLTTTIPLLMFASAAQKIPLSLIGILQYISPTLQFFLGVFRLRRTLFVSSVYRIQYRMGCADSFRCRRVCILSRFGCHGGDAIGIDPMQFHFIEENKRSIVGLDQK